jgi:uncharacterized protein with FMN-binding domain
MKKRTIYQAVPALALAATVAAPAANALAATKHTYKGPTESYRWGTVQVSIVVKSKKITNVKTVYVPHTGRSQFIEDRAVPLLKTEVLQAQSGDIEYVSGATDTSDAYSLSLQAAVNKALKAKTL